MLKLVVLQNTNVSLIVTMYSGTRYRVLPALAVQLNIMQLHWDIAAPLLAQLYTLHYTSSTQCVTVVHLFIVAHYYDV